MKRWCGKAYGQFIRIAGLFHCFECIETDKNPEEYGVSELNAKCAACICDSLYIHAQKVFSSADKINSDAVYLIEKLKIKMREQNSSCFSKRELIRLTHGRFKTAEELTPALELLADYGYITTNFLSTGGRPANLIEVNPLA
jgi:hypothetical protein